MECEFEIQVFEPKNNDMPFHPYVKFRLKQLNLTPDCVNNTEIDHYVDVLIKEAEKLRKKVKKSLKDAETRHDVMVEKMRGNQ